MITIVDSGVANLTSVISALERLEIKAVVTSDPVQIREAERVILPGVGSAPAAMRELEAKGLADCLRGLTQPVLGICLGMQLLFQASEEGAEEGKITPCLGVIDGTIRKLMAGPLPVPHMGWNDIKLTRPDDPLLQGVESGAFMYFVHSFAAPVGEGSLATCSYGEDFTAICRSKKFYGCQFHPERSGPVGAKILQNFIKMRT